MNPTLFFSCLVVLSGCLLGRGNAECACSCPDEFPIEKEHFLQLYGNSTASQDTLESNVPKLVAFYAKYSARLSLSPNHTERAQELLGRYYEVKRDCDAVPWNPYPRYPILPLFPPKVCFLPFVKFSIAQLAKEIASEAISELNIIQRHKTQVE